MLSRTLLRCLGAALATSLASATSPALAQTAPYDELTNTYRPVTNFNVETTRGMHVNAASEILWINTHGSRLCMYLPGGPFAADFVWPTLLNPIAVDRYRHVEAIQHEPPGEAGDGDQTAEPLVTEYAVVLGGGTHAVALHDLADGRVTAVRNLGAETGDLVVDQQRAQAFVSLPGNNTVVQLALPSLRIQAIFEVASQRPRFLFLDRGESAGPGDNVVFVAPEMSGNNSIPILPLPPQPDAFNAFPFSLDPFLPDGLPDEDLFRITPAPASGGPPPTLQAEAMLRNAGTLLMAHGRNPDTGAYWIVGTDCRNTQALSEPELKGVFARNQLTIAPSLWDGSNPVPIAPAAIDLDLVGASYDAKFSIGFPYALTFTSAGDAVIAGSTTDQIRGVDSNGARIGDLELPPGSIPRQMAFAVNELLLLVYCWGTNEIRMYDVGQVLTAMAADPDLIAGPTDGYLASFDIGVDPNLEPVRHGRELFYDGDNSLDARTTCNHCHPGGGMDGIGWAIKDAPHDAKDLMVTQSLKSIEDTFPYHWRGERDLEAFNVAFAGLLGGAELQTDLEGDDRSDFEDFKAFVFGLQAHANPIQNPERVLDPALATTQSSFAVPPGHGPGDPVAGQALMDLEDTLFDRFSCADCHGKVAGTVGDPQLDDASFIPGNPNLDVAHFRQLFHKNHDVVQLSATGPAASRGGFGLSHDGDHSSVFDFLHRNPFDLDDQEERDLAAFVEQADQGISPAAQMAFHVRGNPTATINAVEQILLPQAGPSWSAAHWVSIAAFGRHEDIGGTGHDLRWYYVPGSPGAFFANDPTVTFPDGSVGTQTWAALKAEAAAGRAEFTLLGVPPTNALGYGADPDNDGALDDAELAAGSDPNAFDTDGDGDPDGHEIVHGGTQLDPTVQANDTTPPTFVSGRVDHMGSSYGKLVLVFSEPVQTKITATNTVTGHQAIEYRFTHRMWDTITVQRLKPSLPAIDFETVNYPIADTVGVPYPYTVLLEMTDLAGNPGSISLGAVMVTRDQIVLSPFPEGTTAGSGLPPAFLSREVENLAWTGPPSGGTVFQATADVQHRFDVPEVTAAYANPPNTPNGSASPYEKQVVVAQVLHYDSVGEVWTVLPKSPGSGLTVTAPAGRIHDDVFFQGTGGNDPIPLDGPFVLSTASGGSGQVTFDFTLSQALAPGDLVKLNVIAVLEQNDPTAAANEFWFGSIATWNLPTTAEENRGISYP